jgi:CheY-like chemotaxis protein
MFMPGVDGPELMSRMRAVDRSVAFIAVSGVSSELLRKAASLGAFACMEKPLAPGELAQFIAKARAGGLRVPA